MTRNKATMDGILENEKSQENRIKKGFWKTLKKAAGHIPFIEEVVAAYFCAIDPATPKHVRATLLAALAYFVMPIDAIPDFVAIFGFSDDIAVLTLALTSIRKHLKDEHFQAAIQALSTKTPES